MKKLTKKIKVQMTSKKSAFGYERHTYHPGDIFEIEESMFREDFMEKVVQPKKPVKPPKEESEPEVVEETVEATETVTVTDEGTSEVLLAQAAPKVRKRKKA